MSKTDLLIETDRVVRHGLGVRHGETIARACDRIVAEGITGTRLEAAMAILRAEFDSGWRGLKKAAEILRRDR